LRGPIPQLLQTGPHRQRPTITRVLEYPFGSNGISLGVRVFFQNRRLASDGLLFFLPLGRDSRVNRRCLHPLYPPRQLSLLPPQSKTKSFLEPRADRPATACSWITDQSCTAAGLVSHDSAQPCSLLFRKASRA